VKATPLLTALALALLLAWIARSFATGSDSSGAVQAAASPPAHGGGPAAALHSPSSAALQPTAGRAAAPADAPDPVPPAEPPVEPRGLEDGARPPDVVPPELQPLRGPLGARAE
jgi:hypothetical protein